MGKRGTLQVLVDEVTWLVRIALDKVRTPSAFVRWMDSLGLQFETPAIAQIADTVAALEGAIDATAQFDFERPIEDQTGVFRDIAANLIEAFLAARTLPEALATLSISDVADEVEDLALAAAHDIVATYFERRLPGTYGLFRLFGIIDKPVGSSRREFRPRRLGTLLTEPGELAHTLYRWGDPTEPLDFKLLSERLRDLARAFGIPARLERPSEIVAGLLHGMVGGALTEDQVRAHKVLRVPLYEVGDPELGYAEFGLAFGPYLDQAAAARGLAALVFASGDVSMNIELMPPLSLKPRVGADVVVGVGLKPVDGALELTAAAAAALDFGATLRLAEPGSKIIVVGDTGGSRFEVGGIQADFDAALSAASKEEFKVELLLDEGAIIVAPGDGDGFLNKVLPADGFRADFSFLVGWSSIHGLYFGGSAGFEVTIPVQLEIGPVVIESVYLALHLRVDESGEAPPYLETALAVSVSIAIGPVAGVVEEIGVTAKVPLPPKDFDALEFGFKPPKGVGLSVEAGPIEGGGYLFIDTGNERYAGILSLRFGEIGLTAIGLITTRFPDGSKGFSLLGIINVLFDPGIALSFGFFLGGVGGYLGINRTMVTEEVQKSAQDGSIDALLFPPDPIENATAIIASLRRIFPPARDRFLLGVGLRIVWGQPALVVVDLALILEIPEPIKIAVFGRLAAVLPDEEAELLSLRFYLAGILDTEKKLISIDAGLYDSHVIGFPITGSMALRARWGDSPMFIMAAGGFDPDFKVPAGFPKLQPLGISIGANKNPRLSLGGYFAITPNTVQFGARIDLFVKAGDFSVDGYLLFAALFQFSPFYFRAFMGGSLSVKMGSKRLMGADIELFLEGPTPWHARGTAKFKILFVEVNAGFDVTFGKEKVRKYLPADPWQTVLEQIRNPKNWQPVGGRFEDVPGEERTVLLVPPDGVLEVRQRVVPFGIEIRKVGNVPTPQPMVFSLEVAPDSSEGWVAHDLRDHFAISQYQHRSAAQRLGDKSYDLQKNGIRLESRKQQFGRVVHVPVRYETKTLKRKGQDPSAVPAAFGRWVSHSQGRRHAALAALRLRARSGSQTDFAIPKTAPIRRKNGGFVLVNPKTGVAKVGLADPKTGIAKAQEYATLAEAEANRVLLAKTSSQQLEVFPTAEVAS